MTETTPDTAIETETEAAGLPDDLAPVLAAALTARGFGALTAVQMAVLAPEARGRDLLVSAQTGSGKTVAFGLAIAPELLDSDAPEAATDTPAPPRALIVAPTRELALQVRREIEWLYAEAGLSVASCVGGMDFRNERRALDRGATIVVGTPGRLRDHIERGSLNLSGLRAAVLDEADEMLDLGFAEDLEFILAAAPPERRTLMFSATVPKAIEALARDYQRDALRVIAQGEARQHGDIAYRALSVAQRDKENAILNLLRLQDAKVAIVFCKTRAAVAHLAARMGNRGFAVVPLSGELGQQERTRALQSLRDGRARICVATDVAARGIDLPGLELVVHADLPSNPDTLLHRSGRTGRAGAKGVSVLVVTPAEYRKAQRILQGARITADWGKPPTAAEVQAAEDDRLLGSELLSAPLAEDEGALAEALAADNDPLQLAAAVVRMWRQGRTAPEVLHDEVDPPAPAASGPPRARAEFGASVWFSISVGHEGRAEARWLLPKVCEAARIGRDSIGAIRVRQHETFVQVAAEVADRLPAGGELEPGLGLTRLDGDPTADEAPSPRGAPRSGPRSGPRPTSDAPRGKPSAPRAARPRSDQENDSQDRPRKPYGAAPRPLWGDGADRPERKPRPAWREDGPPRGRRPEGDAPRPAKPPREDRAERAPYGGRSDEGPRGGKWSNPGPGNRGLAKPRWDKSDASAPRKPRPMGEDARPARPDYRTERSSERGMPDADAPARKPRHSKTGGPRPKPEGFGAKPRAFGGDRSEGAGAPKRGFGGGFGKSGGPRKPAGPAPSGEDRPKRFTRPPKPDMADPGQSLRKPRAGMGPKKGPKPGGKPGPRGPRS